MQSTQLDNEKRSHEVVAEVAAAAGITAKNAYSVDWVRAIPYILLHVACIAVIWVGISPIAVIVAVAASLSKINEPILTMVLLPARSVAEE